jgi:uncharacterized protein
LASRIRYGLEVTSARLSRIDRAETAVRRLLTDLRVRDLGDTARVELPAADIPAAAAISGLAEAIAAAGFADAAIEYAAFRSGILNAES